MPTDEEQISSIDGERDTAIMHKHNANDAIDIPRQGTAKLPATKPSEEDLEAQDSAVAKSGSQIQKPYSAFSNKEKWFIVAMTSMASFFSPLSGQIYLPVLPVLAENYHLSSSLINVSVTTYLIFQGLAPSFMGTFSDASGRRLGYILAFTIYTVANIGLALQNSYTALLVLRCLQSAGSSGTISFGYGVISDIATTGERGKYFGPLAAGVLTAPALGPVIGGLLTEFLGWRAVFWFLTIISGGYLVVYIICMPETLHKIVDDGSIVPQQWWRQSVVQFLAARRRLKRIPAEDRHDYEQKQLVLMEQQKGTKIRFPNPLVSFVILTNPEAFCLIMYTSVMMFSNSVLMITTPTIFPKLYGLNELQVGLCFL
jgi:multidrug resistance protein